MKISVVHPYVLSKAWVNGQLWIYADSDESLKCVVERNLGLEHEAINPKDFQLFARSVRNQVINAMDSTIRQEYVDDWILTPLHRNPYSNDIFLHLVWIEFLRQYESPSRGVVVITKSLGLLKSLESIDEWDVACGFQSFCYLYSEHQVKKARASLGFFVNVVRLLIRMILVRSVISKADLKNGCSAEVIVDSFLYEKDFKADGQYRSSYMPGLVEWYKKNAIDCALVVSVVGVRMSAFLGLYKKIKCSQDVIFPFERIVTVSDLLSAVVDIVVYICRFIGDFGYNKSCPPIVRLAGYGRYQSALGGLHELLYKHLPRRWFELGMKPKILLDWFENQPLDRALAVGVHAEGSTIRHIAFRPYIVAEMHAFLYTSIHQHESGACPQEHWVSGEGLRAMLQATDPIAKYRVVPALRYVHVWNGVGGDPSLSDKPVLAVLLSHSKPESISVLKHVFFDRGLLEDFQVVIRVHKNVPVKYFQDWCIRNTVPVDSVRWEENSLSDMLKVAAFVVSTGTGSALEAVCYGVPVVIIGRRAGLTMNPLTAVDQRMWTEVYSPQELSAVLRAWTPHHPLSVIERMDLGRAIRDEYFCQVNDESMEAFRV